MIKLSGSMGMSPRSFLGTRLGHEDRGRVQDGPQMVHRSRVGSWYRHQGAGAAGYVLSWMGPSRESGVRVSLYVSNGPLSEGVGRRIHAYRRGRARYGRRG